MIQKAEQKPAVPDVVPGYGEADGEAASMDKAAYEEESHEGAGEPSGSRSASDALSKVVPNVAGPIGYGTTETDVKKSIAVDAARKVSKATDPV